jgi:integrase
MRGSIRKRDEGVYQVRVSAGRDPVTGRYKTITETVHGSQSQAEDVAARIIAKVRNGHLAATSGSVRELLDRWIEAQETRGRSPKTIHEYRKMAASIKEGLGHIRLRNLTGADLDRFYAGLNKRGLAPATVHHHHAALSTALRQAVRWGWLDRSPAEQATPPSNRQAEPRAPSVEQIQTLISSAEGSNPDLASLIFVAATTGCRRGELCGLQWDDIDVERAELVVRRSISDVPGNLEIRSTKTGRARRLALDPATSDVLRLQRIRAETRCKSVNSELHGKAYVWSQKPDHSTPWRPDRVTDVFRTLRNRLGLKDVRFHHLRHFAATMMLAGGVDVRTAAGRLGHTQPAVTLKTYAHVLQAPDRVAAELLGRALKPSPSQQVKLD